MIPKLKVCTYTQVYLVSRYLLKEIYLDAILYHGETWELMGRRWGKIEKDFCTKNKRFDISKIPDIYDCIKYDLQHNNHTLQFEHAEELYIYSKYLADIVIPQVNIFIIHAYNNISYIFNMYQSCRNMD